MTRTRPPEERFWPKVDKSGACWEWTAYKLPDGYGRFTIGTGASRRKVLAHRFSYELANGPLAPGLQVDHKCLNRSCVNPSHLRAATNKQNGEHTSGAQRNSKSGVRGVSWDSKSKRWRAQIRHNKKLITAGSFSTIAEAEACAIAKRLELFTHNDMDRRVQA
jgi:hypothetical protein